MVTKGNLNDYSSLPEPLRRKMGIYTSRTKVFLRQEGELIVKAT